MGRVGIGKPCILYWLLSAISGVSLENLVNTLTEIITVSFYQNVRVRRWLGGKGIVFPDHRLSLYLFLCSWMSGFITWRSLLDGSLECDPSPDTDGALSSIFISLFISVFTYRCAKGTPCATNCRPNFFRGRVE